MEAREIPTRFAASSIGRHLKRPDWRGSGTVLAVVGLFVALSIASPAFLTASNLENLLDQSATLGIIAVAGTLVIIAGGFDLSTGAVYALAGVIAAELAAQGHVVLGFLAGVAAGAVVGALNGGLVTIFRVNSFMATLASGLMLRGVAALITGGFLVTVSDPDFANVGTGELFGLPVPIWLFVVIALVLGLVLNRTTFGREIFATGGNPDAARLAGISVARTQVITFALSGAAAAMAGIISASRVSTGQADAGQLIEFDAIVAIVVGGTSIYGGQGAIWRTVLGVLFLSMIHNAFDLLDFDPFYADIVTGGLIILAVALDAFSRRDS